MLEGTSHQTGISEYFTWKYNGEKIIFIPETQEIYHQSLIQTEQ